MSEVTLFDWLIEKYPTSKRQTLRRMVQDRRVRVNGLPALSVKRPITAKDRVEVADRLGPVPVSRPACTAINIIYEDADLLVVDKPAGLLTSTVPREPRPTLLAKVRSYFETGEPGVSAGLIHRLDRDASGLLVFSKNVETYRSLKSQFFHHTVKREYRAVVHGTPNPPSGRIESRLVERADGSVYSTRQHAQGVVAVTHFEVLNTAGKMSLLRVTLHTGRKHQIRVHLRERGCAVVGDRMYGPPDPTVRLMLAATQLTLTHPRSGKEVTFTAPVPKEFPIGAE